MQFFNWKSFLIEHGTVYFKKLRQRFIKAFISAVIHFIFCLFGLLHHYNCSLSSGLHIVYSLDLPSQYNEPNWQMSSRGETVFLLKCCVSLNKILVFLRELHPIWQCVRVKRQPKYLPLDVLFIDTKKCVFLRQLWCLPSCVSSMVFVWKIPLSLSLSPSLPPSLPPSPSFMSIK